MNLCMSQSFFKQWFGTFEHQEDGAQTLQQRKLALAELAKREKSMQTQIAKRETRINALESEIAPVFMQYRKMVADPRSGAAAKRLFKEKIAPLEKQLASEERELKNDKMLLEIGGRVRTKDTAGDARGAYLHALQGYTPFVGQTSARTVDGEQADDILNSITDAQLTLASNDGTLAQSLSSNMARLNNEDALDDEVAGANDTDDQTEESVMRRLNERFQLEESAAPAPTQSSNSTISTTRVAQQPPAAATSIYRGDSMTNAESTFPRPGAHDPASRTAARATSSGRQAVATQVNVDTTGKPRARHVAFDTDY